ncbi:DUF2024 family protein [Fulvivirga sp. M361]|uniref:DUF2024 family protein n=1 Tax=Fulvivirga sp. M361 TaxID=2594266 RepID=UPI00117B68CC|nr:DUF2024 family protein [Fulvivirga sp. M361]TRX59103.1 DUF2024 family protein [Fulvivirga sp. M361]
MRVAVWDTYVNRKDGQVMHFDILVPDTLTDENEIFEFGKAYLRNKAFETEDISAEKCSFCHIAQAPQHVVDSITLSGYHIIEMENCL